MTPIRLTLSAIFQRSAWLAVVLWWMLPGSGPAAAQSPAVRIMPLGDSITRGTNDINYPNGDIPGGYRKKLGELLAGGGHAFDFVGNRQDNPAPGTDPDHNGNNGWRTDQMLANLALWLQAEPNTVLLMAGTNDVLQRIPIATAISNLNSLILQITANAPDRRLYVATLIPITQAWGGTAASVLNADANLFNTQLRSLVAGHANAGRNVTLVDMSALIVLTDPDPSKNFFKPGDGIHPGQAGYNQLGILWFNALLAGGNLIGPPPAGFPAVPSGLTASVASPTRVNLAWTDNAGDETLYQIRHRIVPDGAWTTIAELPADSTAHAVTGLRTARHSYAFSVRAVNPIGASAWSSDAATPPPVDRAHQQPTAASSSWNSSYLPSNAVDGLTSTLWAAGSSATYGAGHWQVDLGSPVHIQQVHLVTRQDADAPAHRRLFEIRGSNDPDFASYSVLASQGATLLPHKSTFSAPVEDSATYRYVRVAKTEVQSMAMALVRVFAADAVVSSAPLDLVATTQGETSVNLTWAAASHNESGFKLQRRVGNSGDFVQVAAPPAAATSIVDSGLAPCTSYQYRLIATNESGDSPPGAVAAVTTGGCTGYELWSLDHPDFLALPEAERLPAADPNHDGVSNLLAYAAGLNPLANTPPGLLAGLASVPPSPLVFRYRRNKLADDLSFAVLVATDLNVGNWSVLDPATATTSDVPGDPEVEEVSIPIPPGPGQSRKFARLRVEL